MSHLERHLGPVDAAEFYNLCHSYTLLLRRFQANPNEVADEIFELSPGLARAFLLLAMTEGPK